MSKYITNKFRNLPLFDNFNFYYNTDSRETKRIIKEDKCTSTSLTIEETLTDKTTGRVTIIDYIYTLDNNVKTYLFYVFKPLIISIIALCIFIKLQYEFLTVIKLEKGITIVTFIVSCSTLFMVMIGLIYVFLIAYRKKIPNIDFLDKFKLIQYIGYATMILIFIVFYLILDEKTTYLYTCLVNIFTMSFYSYAFYLYIFSPLILLREKKLNFYRNNNDRKILLIELKDL